MPESEGLKAARRRLAALPRDASGEQIRKLQAHVTRLEREGRGEDVMTGGIRAPTNPNLKEPSLQQRVRKRRKTEEELGIRRGRP